MQYIQGLQLLWKPIWFRWDVEREVTVVKTYRRGYALLSNDVIVDEDGFAEWHGRIAGKVESLGLAMEKRYVDK